MCIRDRVSTQSTWGFIKRQIMRATFAAVLAIAILVTVATAIHSDPPQGAAKRAQRKQKTQAKIAEQLSDVARIAKNGARKAKESGFLEMEAPAHERARRKQKTQGGVVEDLAAVARIAKNGVRKAKEAHQSLLQVEAPAHERAKRKQKTQAGIAEAVGEVARIAKNGAKKSRSALIDFGSAQEDALKFQVHSVYVQLNTNYASCVQCDDRYESVCQLMREDVTTMLKKIKNAEKKRGDEIESVAEEKRELKHWAQKCKQYQQRQQFANVGENWCMIAYGHIHCLEQSLSFVVKVHAYPYVYSPHANIYEYICRLELIYSAIVTLSLIHI
eukprot:TRINITY_DN1889_c0_g2_i3.p1 TRINITY_DN1889_c0_g2~~TRINITY_DN1889_c0_g2_i3.p1  ORF type:complete len:368 (-),score=124.48 TRINITY_DN1889_c0_g2_i3:62-1051(-)